MCYIAKGVKGLGGIEPSPFFVVIFSLFQFFENQNIKYECNFVHSIVGNITYFFISYSPPECSLLFF